MTFDCDIYITGSNAKLLSSELATYLTGRYVEFEIYPFSFREFKEIYLISFPNSTDNTIFNKYVELGGMPFINDLNFDKVVSKKYLSDVFDSLILKDVVKRNNIRDIDLLERLIHYLTENIGTSFSSTSISKYFKNEGRTVNTETIQNYIKGLESAYLFYKVQREDLQGKKILSVNEKYYIVDHGLREAYYNNNYRDINLVLENIVFIELLSQGYSVTVGKIKDKEIDFIAKKNNNTIYIQVAYILSSTDTVEREFSNLENIKDNYPKYVLSLDEFDMSRNGIIHKNIRDFLLYDL